MSIPRNVPVEQALTAQRIGYPTTLPWDQISGRFGIEPGRVFIDDFDLGVVLTMGAFLDPNAPVDRPSFVLKVPGLKLDEQRQADNPETDVVPVTFGHPEAYMSLWTLPGVFVRREGIEPDLTRYSQELEAYRAVAPNTNENAEGRITFVPPSTPNDPTGPAELIQSQRAEAYNFTYLIDMVARYRTDANALLKAILPRFKQHKAIIVKDSKGDYNEYTCFLDSIDDLQEVLGVTLKHVGYTISIRVIGELDVLGDNVIRPTARVIETGVISKNTLTEAGSGARNHRRLTPDGLVLKTYPSRVLGRICSHVWK